MLMVTYSTPSTLGTHFQFAMAKSKKKKKGKKEKREKKKGKKGKMMIKRKTIIKRKNDDRKKMKTPYATSKDFRSPFLHLMLWRRSYILPSIPEKTSICLVEEGALRLLAGLRGLMEMLGDIHHRVHMLHLQPFPPLAGQQLGRLQDVLDLPAVEGELGELHYVLLIHLVWMRAVVMELLGFFLLFFARGCTTLGGSFGGRDEHLRCTLAGGGLGDVVLFEEVLPNGLAALDVQLLVLDADVNAGL